MRNDFRFCLGVGIQIQIIDQPSILTGFPDQGDALKVQENANSGAMPNPLFQQIPEPMITGCKYDGKPGWQHIPQMSQEVDLWWAILEHGGGGFRGWDMSTEPQNVSGSGVGRIYFEGRGLCM